MKKKVLHSDRWPKQKGPYSVALSFDRLLFISGQGPAYADTGEIVKGDFNEQARVVFENLRMILEDSGYSLEHVLKATVFLSDINNFSKMNEIYAQYFKKDQPARTTVQVARLPFDIMLEIDVIAYLPK